MKMRKRQRGEKREKRREGKEKKTLDRLLVDTHGAIGAIKPRGPLVSTPPTHCFFDHPQHHFLPATMTTRIMTVMISPYIFPPHSDDNQIGLFLLRG